MIVNDQTYGLKYYMVLMELNGDSRFRTDTEFVLVLANHVLPIGSARALFRMH